MAEELDREPHYDQEEGNCKEDRQGGNIVLLGPGRDAALALAQAFGDQALLDRAGRLYACSNLGLVAVVGAEAGCICRRAGGSATAQHGHGAVHLFGAARLWLAHDIPRLSRVAHGRTGSCIGRARGDRSTRTAHGGGTSHAGSVAEATPNIRAAAATGRKDVKRILKTLDNSYCQRRWTDQATGEEAKKQLGAEQVQWNLSSIGVGSVFSYPPRDHHPKGSTTLLRVTNNATNNHKIRPHFARQGFPADAIHIEGLDMQEGLFAR